MSSPDVKPTNIKPAKTGPVTLQDVADHVGVSRAAVARVLLGSGSRSIRVGKATADKIRTSATELEYHPNRSAQQLAGRSSHVIGAIIDRRSPQIQFNRLAAMEEEAAQLGYRLMVGQTRGKLDRLIAYAEDFASRGVDGVICITHRYPGIEERVAETYARLSNVVFIGQPASDREDLNVVAVDTASGITQSVRHLAAQGCDRIALLIYGSGTPQMEARIRGYREGHVAIGREVNESLIQEVGQAPAKALDAVGDRVKLLVREHRVDAVIAVDDSTAVMTIKHLKALGRRVPEDVAVVGYDDSEISRLYEPAISSVDQKSEQVSSHAIGLLMMLIAGKQVEQSSRHIVVKPELIVRASSRRVHNIG